MVLLVLVGVGHREARDRLVQRVAPAHVPAEHGGGAGSGVGECEGPSTPPGVDRHLRRAEGLHQDAELHVPQLAEEEVALRPPAPAEEHVAGGLHEPVAVHDALAVVRKGAGSSVRLQDRGTRLLDLEEQGVSLAGRQEEDPAEGADAPDPNHLDRGVSHLVAVQQGLVGVRQRAAVAGEHVPDGLLDLARAMPLGVEDRGELVLDHGDVSLVLHELREHLLAAALRLLFLDALHGPLAEIGRKARDELLCRQRPVPQLQSLQLAELGHRLTVGADAGQGDVSGHAVLQVVVPAGHDEARGEALDVPFPGCGQRLVEVVDGEDDLPFRGGEAAEVAQVRVPAALDADPAAGRRRQVGRHRQRRPAVERESRADHAPVPQREEVRHAALLRRQDHLDGVAPVGRDLPAGVRLARAARPEGLARDVAFRA